MRVLLAQARIKHCHFHTGSCTITQERSGVFFFFFWAVMRENKASGLPLPPVCPICQRTSAWRIWATWRGIARSRRRLEWRPVACQKPDPRDRLVRRKGRDDCHDCHFCVLVLALHGAVGSAAFGAEQM